MCCLQEPRYKVDIVGFFCVFLLQEPKYNKVDIVCGLLIAGAQVQQGSSRAAVPWHARPPGALQLGPGDQPLHPLLQPKPGVQKL